MSTLPRGPKSSLLQLSMLLPFRDPLDSVAKTARSYGDPMTIPTLQGPLVVTWEEMARLPYLQAVCEEALRLYPVTPFVNRKLKRPFTLKGYELPAGVSVSAGTYLAHLREETFPDALQFKPERFLDRTYSPFEYMPFGGGSRRCLGAAFAMYEMKIVLGTLFTHYRLGLAEKGMVKPTLRAVTVGPRGGVRVVVRGRA